MEAQNWVRTAREAPNTSRDSLEDQLGHGISMGGYTLVYQSFSLGKIYMYELRALA